MASVRDRNTLREAAKLLERAAKAPQQRAARFAIQLEAATEEPEQHPAPDQCMDVARRLRLMAKR